MGVLILNASYEPLGVIKVKRAVTLILEGKVSVLAESNEPFRGTYEEVNVPTVVKLNYMVKVPHRARAGISRRGVLVRDGFVCQFTHCNRKADTIDHIWPQAKGGGHEWTNLVAACGRCNSKKADKTLEQMHWKLKREPYQPKGSAWIAINYKIHPDWIPYLPDGANI